jgi:hypothetical protein
VTAVHQIQKQAKENYSIARTNDCISNEIERPLKVINATTTIILQELRGKTQFKNTIDQM